MNRLMIVLRNRLWTEPCSAAIGVLNSLSPVGSTRVRTTRRSTVRSLILLGMILLVATPYSLHANEFDCEVSVNDRQISDSAYDYVQELGPDLERYINENSWTEDRFDRHERIRCRMQIVLTDVDSQYNYTAEVIFQLRRPVYNSMQETVSVVLSDTQWSFHYPRSRSLIRDYIQFDDLTSFVDFYMYILLGYDYDSFSELGGTRFFERAMDVRELALASGGVGWDRGFGSSRNRYGLISDLQSPVYEGLRRGYYQYHRHGLDVFVDNPTEARRAVVEALEWIRENRRRATNNYLFDIFFDTKYTELVSIFREAPPVIRGEAYDLLTSVDPGHSSTYDQLQ
ncbi:MAG: DUF4835 family protein [Balneolaceae bacterium]